MIKHISNKKLTFFIKAILNNKISPFLKYKIFWATYEIHKLQIKIKKFLGNKLSKNGIYLLRLSK